MPPSGTARLPSAPAGMSGEVFQPALDVFCCNFLYAGSSPDARKSGFGIDGPSRVGLPRYRAGFAGVVLKAHKAPFSRHIKVPLVSGITDLQWEAPLVWNKLGARNSDVQRGESHLMMIRKLQQVAVGCLIGARHPIGKLDRKSVV